MAPGATDRWNDDERRRLGDQTRMIGRANPEGVERDSRWPDARFDRNHVLFDTNEVEEGQLQEVFSTRGEQFEGSGSVVGTVLDGRLAVFELPVVRRTSKRNATQALRIIERDSGGLRVYPDHLLHVSPGDHGRPCPATEPAETGLDEPWPPLTTKSNAGRGVTVAVVDTGRYQPAEHHPRTQRWLGDDVHGDDEPISGDLEEYAGHGTFIAGVVRCRAPRATIRHERFAIPAGGAIRESVLIEQLDQALSYQPEIINLSAGTHTRSNDPLKSFDLLYETKLKAMKNTVLVAAAGNDGLDKEFYPAAMDWCVGVGSLDRDGRISSFSNRGPWVDVYAIGRNHVNAYPDGRYVCKETPDKDDVRWFTTGMARWSGTSFATPVVAGILARLAADRAPGTTVRTVTKDWLTNGLRQGTDSHGNPFKYVARPYG